MGLEVELYPEPLAPQTPASPPKQSEVEQSTPYSTVFAGQMPKFPRRKD